MMFLFVNLLLWLTAFAQPAVPGDTDPGTLTRIIDGVAPIKLNYYEVAIVTDSSQADVFVCSGALLNYRWIITSAYCANRKPKLRIEYGTGSILGDGNAGQLVYKKYVHPSYNPTYLLNDIALLEMNPPLSSTFINTVTLPATTLDSYLGQTGEVSGWGASASYGLYNNILQSKQVYVISNAFCQYLTYITPYKLCTERRVACDGDQGAPLVIGSTIVGVTSLANNALQCEGMTAVSYTRVNYYIGWIRQVSGI